MKKFNPHQKETTVEEPKNSNEFKDTVKGLTSAAVTQARENVILVNNPVMEDTKPHISSDEFMQPLTKELIDQIDYSQIGEDDIFHESVVAVDIKLPSYLDIKPKDPSIMFRWVNRKFNGEGGNRYEQMCAMGFSNTEPSDCLGVFDPNRIKTADNTITCNDVILMKINKLRLLGYYKANFNKSNRIFARKNVHEEAKTMAKHEFQVGAGSVGANRAAYNGKVGFFVPDRVPGMNDDLEG